MLPTSKDFKNSDSSLNFDANDSGTWPKMLSSKRADCLVENFVVHLGPEEIPEERPTTDSCEISHR
jgi:hypothetical protein